MSLADDVDLEELVMTKDDLSGADIKAVCTEAGLLALRERRMRVTKEDFTSAREKVLYRKDENTVSRLDRGVLTPACGTVSLRGVEHACIASVQRQAVRSSYRSRVEQPF